MPTAILAETSSSSTPIYILVLLLCGGLGALLIGMRLLQDACEKLATTGLRKLFRKTASSKLAGVGIGTLATMIMQSSGATTVMVVGFVNAGVMTLSQAVGYIMGANIGTTITAQIVALGGLSSSVFPITEILISCTLFGVILSLFFKKKFPKAALAGDMLSGLGLLFLGLEVMTTNMQGMFLENEQISAFLTSITNPFLLLLIGIVLTCLAQSSSAVTSIVLALAMAGATIGGQGNGVLYVILGSNIGSCSTALLSAIGSTTNGKRTAVIHLLFNVFGSILFFIVLLCWPSCMEMTFVKMFPNAPATQIAMFHTFFNVLCTLLFLPFSDFFVFLSKKIVPDKKEKKDHYDLLDERFLSTPELALSQAFLFYHQMAKDALDDLLLSIQGFEGRDLTLKEKIDNKENEVLKKSKELTSYLVQVSSKGLSPSSSDKASNLQLDIADIVRLTEVADNITGYTKHEVNDELTFSAVVFDQIEEMKKLLTTQFAQSEKMVDEPSKELLEKTRATEDAIDNLRSKMVKEHMKRLADGECKPQNSNVFINLVGNLERCGDHLNFIAERSAEGLKDSSDPLNLHP